MLNNELFLEKFLIFTENFGFEASAQYQIMLYTVLKNKITNALFIEATNYILFNTTLEEWNKAYGYKGKPAIADWLEVFVPKAQWIKKYEHYKEPITGANCVRQVRVKVDNQLTITKSKK